MTHKLLPGSPELYHGTEKSRPYFEGWYFKHVSEKTGFSLAVIPGVYRSRKKSEDHCFIQVLHNNDSYYIKYPIEEFKFNTNEFEINIGGSFFSLSNIILDIFSDEISVKAKIAYSNQTPLKTSTLSPSIMGPFSFFPGMQCNHGVLSLNHDAGGIIIINGVEQDVSGLSGYIEKDWGEAFPDSWLWLQCNGTSKKYGNYSCMCSYASIPYAFLNFKGLIALVMYEGMQHRFATYNFSRVTRLVKNGRNVEITIKKFNLELIIKAVSPKASVLKAPAAEGMARDIRESLNAEINVSLKKRGKVIFEQTHSMGGLEISEIDSIIINKAHHI